MPTPRPEPTGKPGWDWTHSTREQRPERPSGLLHAAIGLAAAGLLALTGHPRLALLPLAIGLFTGLLAQVSPPALRSLQAVTRGFGLGVGRALALFFIGLTMLLVFAPAGLFLRRRGRLRLAVKPRPGPHGYWRIVDRSAPSDYRRQF